MMIIDMELANESYPGSNPGADRALFVENLGVLLSQTREGIQQAYLDYDDMVHVVYHGGSEKLINVAMDSYMAIIRDVVKRL